MLKIFINSFVLFFITIDTIGNLPFFLTLTEDAKFKKRTQIAIKSTVIAFFILIAFAYIGRYLLEALGVTLDSLKIAGGIILMFIAIDILFEKRKIRREKKVEEALDEKNYGEIVDAVGDKLDVICEGGIHRGTHILKALSMGAKACSGGRLYLYALAAGGQAGVERAIEKYKDELVRDMKLMGCTKISDLNRNNLRFRR